MFTTGEEEVHGCLDDDGADRAFLDVTAVEKRDVIISWRRRDTAQRGRLCSARDTTRSAVVSDRQWRDGEKYNPYLVCEGLAKRWDSLSVGAGGGGQEKSGSNGPSSGNSESIFEFSG